MHIRFVIAVVASSLVIGIGLGLSLENKPFVLEAKNTPLGTFVVRYNVNPLSPTAPPKSRS